MIDIQFLFCHLIIYAGVRKKYQTRPFTRKQAGLVI